MSAAGDPVPLAAKHEWDEVKGFSLAVAEVLATDNPHRRDETQTRDPAMIERKAHIPTPEPPHLPQPVEPPPGPPVNPRPIDDPTPPKQLPPVSDPPPDEKPNPPRY